jgi:hypothetical protein
MDEPAARPGASDQRCGLVEGEVQEWLATQVARSRRILPTGHLKANRQSTNSLAFCTPADFLIPGNSRLLRLPKCLVLTD